MKSVEHEETGGCEEQQEPGTMQLCPSVLYTGEKTKEPSDYLVIYTYTHTLNHQKFGVSKISLLHLPMLHLFDQKYIKPVKYYHNLTVLRYLKIFFCGNCIKHLLK